MKKGEILFRYHRLKQINRNIANTDFVNISEIINKSVTNTRTILSPLGGKLEKGLVSVEFLGYKKGIKLTKNIET